MGALASGFATASLGLHLTLIGAGVGMLLLVGCMALMSGMPRMK